MPITAVQSDFIQLTINGLRIKRLKALAQIPVMAILILQKGDHKEVINAYLVLSIMKRRLVLANRDILREMFT